LSEDSPENWAKAVQTSSAMEAVKVGGTVGGRIFQLQKVLGDRCFVDFTKKQVFFFAFDRELSRRSLPLGLQRGVVRCLPYLKILMVMVALD